MAVEIEAKMKVADLSVVRERLRAAAATSTGSALETNIFFDTPDCSLLAADEGLRLRRATRVDDNTTSHVITFKGPRQPGQLKSRDEIELGVDHFDGAIKLLDRLGFRQVLAFEKKRESWKLRGCKIELDELPLLGTYVEIEGPRDESVLDLRKFLRLDDTTIVKASYVALLITQLQELGRTDRSVFFVPASTASTKP